MSRGRRKPAPETEPADSKRPTLHSPPPDFDLDDPTLRENPMDLEELAEEYREEQPTHPDDELPPSTRNGDQEERHDTVPAPPPDGPESS